MDESRLPAAPLFDVQVECVVTGIDLAAREPAVERLVGLVEDLVPFAKPMDLFGDFAPESLGVAQRAINGGLKISFGHVVLGL